jgi:hypothetical protein
MKTLFRRGPILLAMALSWALAAPAAARREPSEKAAATSSCGVEDLVAGKKPSASQGTRGDSLLITDGAVGAEGSAWDAPVVVKLETGTAFVSYDLGAPRLVSALVLQADANDTYKILGSLEGTPASFKPLAEIANVVERGAGLRTRAVELAPTTVRYLQVGGASGDGFYSISELAAYCRRPTPFPPAMRVVATPPAQLAETPAAPPAGGHSRSDGSALVLAVAAAGMVWLAYRTVKRQ